MILTDGYSLEIALAGAVNSTQPEWLISYGDRDEDKEAATEDTIGGATNDTTPVEMLADPGASLTRWVRYVSFVNLDDAPVTPTITRTDGVTPITFWGPTLQPGDRAAWTPDGDWRVSDSSGQRKVAYPASILVGQIAYGTARQVLQTNAGATAAEWTSNLDLPGTLDVTGAVTLDSTFLRGHTALLAMGGTTPSSQSHGVGAGGAQYGLGRWSADTGGPRFVTGKSRGTSPGSYTIISAGDNLGAWDAVGADGVDLATIAGRLQWANVGTPAANRIGGSLNVFLAPGVADDDLTSNPLASFTPYGTRFRGRGGDLTNVQDVSRSAVDITDDTATTVLSVQVPNPANDAACANCTVFVHFNFHTRVGVSHQSQAVLLAFTLARVNDVNTGLGAIGFITGIVDPGEQGTNATQTTLASGQFSLTIASGGSTAEQTVALQFTNNFDDTTSTARAYVAGWIMGAGQNAAEAPYLAA